MNDLTEETQLSRPWTFRMALCNNNMASNSAVWKNEFGDLGHFCIVEYHSDLLLTQSLWCGMQLGPLMKTVAADPVREPATGACPSQINRLRERRIE